MRSDRSVAVCPTIGRPAPGPAPASRAGMTLVEMLVAVTVLSAMILMVSSIMVQSQRFISISTASRRSHRIASAIGRMIRSDLRRVSFNGFLCITKSDVDDTPLLIFTTAGTAYTITGAPAAGAGSIVCYGQIKNASDDVISKSGYQLLWRPAFVLVPASQQLPPGPEPQDMFRSSLAEVLTKDVDAIHKDIDALVGLHSDADESIHVPPGRNVEDINQLWQVLAKDCSGLSIMWTDGRLVTDTSGTKSLAWYGIDGDLFQRSAETSIDGPTLPGNQGGYRALWTHHNQNNWPKAIKIRFHLKDARLIDYLPAEMRREDHAFVDGYVYEIIANIRQ